MRIGCDRFLACFPLRHGTIFACITDFVLLSTLFAYYIIPEYFKLSRYSEYLYLVNKLSSVKIGKCVIVNLIMFSFQTFFFLILSFKYGVILIWLLKIFR